MPELSDKDVRDLEWVAEVLEWYTDGSNRLTRSVHGQDQDLRDLAGVIRSKLPKQQRDIFTTGAIISDRNNSMYAKHGDTWYYVDGETDYALEVPFEAIQGPITVAYHGFTVVR